VTKTHNIQTKIYKFDKMWQVLKMLSCIMCSKWIMCINKWPQNGQMGWKTKFDNEAQNLRSDNPQSSRERCLISKQANMLADNSACHCCLCCVIWRCQCWEQPSPQGIAASVLNVTCFLLHQQHFSWFLTVRHSNKHVRLCILPVSSAKFLPKI